MGATSVTGKGLGSADGRNKASEHLTIGVSHLIGPRVVAAGSATVGQAGSVAIEIPEIGSDLTDFIVLATSTNATAHATNAVLSAGTESTVVTIYGTAADVVGWAIVKFGV